LRGTDWICKYNSV